jgi:hypothetical protein
MGWSRSSAGRFGFRAKVRGGASLRGPRRPCRGWAHVWRTSVAISRERRCGARRLQSEVIARTTRPLCLNASKGLRAATIVADPLGDGSSQVPVLRAQHLESIHQRTADPPEGVGGMECGEILDQLATDGGSEMPATLQQAEKSFCPRCVRRRRQRTLASLAQCDQRQGCVPPLDKSSDRPCRNSCPLVVVVTLSSRRQRLLRDLLNLGLVGVAGSTCQCLAAKPGILDRQRHASGCGRVARRKPTRTITRLCWGDRVDPHNVFLAQPRATRRVA